MASRNSIYGHWSKLKESLGTKTSIWCQKNSWMNACYPTHTHQNHWTAVTAVDFHLAETIQQQVEVDVCAKTKKKGSFVEL